MAKKNEDQQQNADTKAPTHNVYVVDDSRDRSYWTKVGGAWKHSDGEGFNIIIVPGISVSGRLVIRERKADSED